MAPGIFWAVTVTSGNKQMSANNDAMRTAEPKTIYSNSISHVVLLLGFAAANLLTKSNENTK